MILCVFFFDVREAKKNFLSHLIAHLIILKKRSGPVLYILILYSLYFTFIVEERFYYERLSLI
jgi:hypothetical protein